MKNSPQYDMMCKFLIVGSTQVGKTNLLTRFSENVYHEHHITTIGVDFKFKEMKINSKIMKMQIWDTAGQERFRTLTQSYYKGAHGVLMVYSVDDMSSYQDIANWMQSLKQQGRADIQLILVANKVDLEDRIVSTQQGIDLAEQLQVEYFETSAKTGKNVQEVFLRIAMLVESNYSMKVQVTHQNDESMQKVNLIDSNKSKKHGCC